MLFVNHIHMERAGRHKDPADEKYGLLNCTSSIGWILGIEAPLDPALKGASKKRSPFYGKIFRRWRSAVKNLTCFGSAWDRNWNRIPLDCYGECEGDLRWIKNFQSKVYCSWSELRKKSFQRSFKEFQKTDGDPLWHFEKLDW